MVESPAVTRRGARVAGRVVYAALVVHALYVVLTAEWPEAAALAFVLAVWYDYRASTTLRRVHRRVFGYAGRPSSS
ncbi:hypothetical protein [Halorubellus sp. PRR65]|uniref:hypothetical protein n=1 Tax=Halorubellus sp. PRR65 TaxID=3098148 RepID=UPI002B25E1CA|nr:hypothetical protein [Halorubellus sp. PRR65]